MENFREYSRQRNTVPSDADSRAATFLIRHAGKIYFQFQRRLRRTRRRGRRENGTNVRTKERTNARRAGRESQGR